jgi:large subunit ribosomal protein L21
MYTMQAVIASGGKQYLVSKDQTLELELLGDVKKIEFDVLLLIDGDKIQVGAPHVSGAKVHAEVIEEVKGEKIKVLKFKPKKRIKRLTGHRQHYSQVKITKIG